MLNRQILPLTLLLICLFVTPLYAGNSREEMVFNNSTSLEGTVSIDWHLDRDKSGRSPLHNAVLDQDYNAVKSILDCKSANINGRDHIKQTPLHLAALKGNTGIIMLLIDKGADLNAKDKYGDTPLHIAVRSGNRDATRVLIKSGADVTKRNNSLKKPIDYAYSRNDSDIITMLRNAKGENYVDSIKDHFNVKSR